jgi:hypothetical protein
MRTKAQYRGEFGRRCLGPLTAFVGPALAVAQRLSNYFTRLPARLRSTLDKIYEKSVNNSANPQRCSSWEMSMSVPRVMWNVTAAIVIANLLSIAASITPASAGSLFFFKGPTKARSETTCLSFALSTANGAHLTNIQHNNLSVSGIRGDFYAAMTCVGTVVVVMVAGNSGEDGHPLALELFNEVTRIQNID